MKKRRSIYGTESRKGAKRQAWEEYNAQILLDTRM